jgi:hypothetical protein
MNSSVPNLKESNWKTLMPLIKKKFNINYGVKINPSQWKFSSVQHWIKGSIILSIDNVKAKDIERFQTLNTKEENQSMRLEMINKNGEIFSHNLTTLLRKESQVKTHWFYLKNTKIVYEIDWNGTFCAKFIK